jgi:hypothetical protein
VRGAAGNSRPYRDRRLGHRESTRMTHLALAGANLLCCTTELLLC